MEKEISKILSEINNHINDCQIEVVDYSHTFNQQTKEELLEDGIIDIENHILFDIQVKVNGDVNFIDVDDVENIVKFISTLESMKNIHVELFYDYKEECFDSLIINFRTRNENKEFTHSVHC